MISNYFQGSIFKIVAKHSKKVLDIKDGSHADGSLLQQWDDSDVVNQKFAVLPFDESGDYFAIVCIASGKVLDVPDGSTNDSIQINQWTYGNVDNQKFKLEPVPSESNTFYIRAKHSGKVFNISGMSQDNGAAVMQYTFSEEENTKFIFEKVGQNLQQMLEVLDIFLKRNPKPNDINFKLNPICANALNLLNDNRWKFYPYELPLFEGTDKTLWFQKAKNNSGVSEPPELWSVYDTLSVLTMLSFGIPKIGIPLSGMLDGVSHILGNEDARAEYFKRILEAKNQHKSEIERVGDQLKKLISSESVQSELSLIFSQVIELDSLMNDMLLIKRDTFSVQQKGFNPQWLETPRNKKSVLSNEYLGKVWTLVDSFVFDKFIHQSNKLIDKVQELPLIEKPTASMITIGVYCNIITIVVVAIELYAVVRLLPDEALKPGWDPSNFNLNTAIASERKLYDDQLYQEKTAIDCYVFLADKLDPSKSENWLTRVDPKTGDAVEAYKKIVARLNRISFASNLPGFRDGFWFLPEDKQIDLVITPTGKKPSTHFKDQCLSGQSELKDTTLTTSSGDTFVEPFKNFHTELKINWKRPDAAIEIFTSIAGTEAIVYDWNRNHSSFTTPWGGSSGYNQVSWGLDESQVRFDTIAWLGYVLRNYAQEFNYSIDLKNQKTTYDVTCITYDYLCSQYKYVKLILSL